MSFIFLQTNHMAHTNFMVRSSIPVFYKNGTIA
jgi:hypothetical protein